MEAREARELLGVAEGATPAEIGAAFRVKILDAHPDAGGSTEAVSSLVEARECLLKPARQDAVLAVRAQDPLAVRQTAPSEIASVNDFRAHAQEMSKRLTSRTVSPLRSARNLTWALAGALALYASVSAVLDRLTRTYNWYHGQYQTMAWFFAAALGFAGIVTQQAVRRLEMAMDEAMYYLGNKSDCADFLAEYLESAGQPPWTLAQLGKYLEEGLAARVRTDDFHREYQRRKAKPAILDRLLVQPIVRLRASRPQSLPKRFLVLLRRIGRDDFARLVVLKATEHGVLKEIDVHDERLIVRVGYSPVRTAANTSANADSA